MPYRHLAEVAGPVCRAAMVPGVPEPDVATQGAVLERLRLPLRSLLLPIRQGQPARQWLLLRL